MAEHTLGPWRVGLQRSTVVADAPVPGIRGSDALDYYGGHLICESVAPQNRPIIAAAPDLLAACNAAAAMMEVLPVDVFNAHAAVYDQLCDAINKSEEALCA